MNRDIANLRSAIEAITSLIAGRGLRVTQRGTDAFVEKCPKTNKPIRVNIPHLPDNASQELILAIHGFIDHECGHVLDTDYDVWREVDEYAKSMKRASVFHMWNITEDTYIERAQAKRFAGAGYNLERLHDFFVNGITLPKLLPAIAAEDHERIFNILFVPMCRAWAGQPIFIHFMTPFWPLVAKEVAKVGALKDRFPGIANSRESFELSKDLWQVLYAPPPPPPAPPPPPPVKAPPMPKAPPPPPKEESEPGERGEGDEPSDAGKGDEGEGEAREPEATPEPEAKPEPKAKAKKEKPDAEEEPGAGDEPDPEPKSDESDDADGTDEPAEPDEGDADGDSDGDADDEVSAPSSASSDDDAEHAPGFSEDGTDDPLTKEQRRILKSRYDRKLSFEEIARRLRKPEHDVVSIHDAALATIEANLKASS